MSRLLALEWNEEEARVALAGLTGDNMVIEQAFSVALRSPQPGSEGSDVDAGQRISAALAARRIGRVDTLVAIGRANIELRQLSVPPAPDEELPDLVRFQALKEFNAMEEDWLLDFLPLDDAPGEGREVLAAAISPGLVDQIRVTCHGAGLKPRRLILRPCAAASLLVRSQATDAASVRLLIDLLGGEADLTVMIGGKVVFLRTARLPGDPLTSSEASQSLQAETRRTIAAAQNHLGGRPVESMVLFGAGDPHQALAERLQEQLGIPTELFDPFAGLTLGRELRKVPPDSAGRFAPLLGILLDELEERPHAIDFLHPRRRPEPPSRRTLYTAGGLAAAAVVLLALVFGWMHRSSINNDIKRLKAESNRLDKEVAQATRKVAAAGAIEDWTAQETNWLDELRWLSDEFPSAEETMITQLELSGKKGGKIEFDGFARDVNALKKMDRSLDDETHQVVGQGDGEASSRERYSARFDRAVNLNRGER